MIATVEKKENTFKSCSWKSDMNGGILRRPGRSTEYERTVNYGFETKRSGNGRFGCGKRSGKMKKMRMIEKPNKLENKEEKTNIS
jgi:hypothetical protein